MLDTTLQRTSLPGSIAAGAGSQTAQALRAGWRQGLAIVNLRGDPGDAEFVAAVKRALGLALPTNSGSTDAGPALRIVWAGPDDWFVIGPKEQADALVQQLRAQLGKQHAAVTDVSSGYTVLHLSGPPVREVLGQGCPLDLHPSSFRAGQCAGSHFFKASVWLWQLDDEPAYELLVRRSFTGYVWTMLERTTLECGLVTRRFA